MTDGEALLKAIIADPSDDTPRLVYSDWLEENGQLERAEYIRLAIEYARLTAGRKRENLTCLDIYLDPDDADAQAWKHEVWKMHAQLNRLLSMPQVFMETVKRIRDISIDSRIEWWRGFPYRLKTTWENWLKHHERLRDLIPLEEVDLTTKPHFYCFDYGLRIFHFHKDKLHQFTDWLDKNFYTTEEVTDRLLKLDWPGIKFRIVEDTGSFQTHSGD